MIVGIWSKSTFTAVFLKLEFICNLFFCVLSFSVNEYAKFVPGFPARGKEAG